MNTNNIEQFLSRTLPWVTLRSMFYQAQSGALSAVLANETEEELEVRIVRAFLDLRPNLVSRSGESQFVALVKVIFETSLVLFARHNSEEGLPVLFNAANSIDSSFVEDTVSRHNYETFMIDSVIRTILEAFSRQDNYKPESAIRGLANLFLLLGTNWGIAIKQA